MTAACPGGVSRRVYSLIWLGGSLVQWRGLPYSECTWETPADIHNAGGQAQIDQFQARPCCRHLLRALVLTTRILSNCAVTAAVECHGSWLKRFRMM